MGVRYGYEEITFSSCEPVGAISEAVIHDLRVNFFTFDGFPQITVTPNNDKGDFIAALSINNIEAEIILPLADVKKCVKAFENKKIVGDEIFKNIQTAIVALESGHREESD